MDLSTLYTFNLDPWLSSYHLPTHHRYKDISRSPKNPNASLSNQSPSNNSLNIHINNPLSYCVNWFLSGQTSYLIIQCFPAPLPEVSSSWFTGSLRRFHVHFLENIENWKESGDVTSNFGLGWYFGNRKIYLPDGLLHQPEFRDIPRNSGCLSQLLHGLVLSLIFFY